MVDAGRCDCRESVCWAEENGFTSVLLTPLDAARETEAETGIGASTPPRVKHGLACRLRCHFLYFRLLLNEARGNGNVLTRTVRHPCSVREGRSTPVRRD